MSSSSVDWGRLNSPFPVPPRSLPAFAPSLHFHEQDVPHVQLSVGQNFVLTWESVHGGHLLISHVGNLEKVHWASQLGQGFVVAARGDAVVEESRGSFAIHDTPSLLLSHQVVTHVGPTADGAAVEVRGVLCSDWATAHALVSSGVGSGCPRWRCWASRTWGSGPQRIGAPYTLTFHEAGPHHLTFHLRVAPPSLLAPPSPEPSLTPPAPSGTRWSPLSWFRSVWQASASVRPSDPLEPLLSDTASPHHPLPPVNRVGLVYSVGAAERFCGFGEQFSHFDFSGRRVSILVQEQGLGRGDQPITAAANFASHRSGGSQDSTYAPVPFYMTSEMRALFLSNYEHAVFDMRSRGRVAVHVHSAEMRGSCLVGDTPPQLIECYTAIVGRMRRLPDWVTDGAIVGMQGGTDRVLSVLHNLSELGVPVSAIWLQDWCGQRKTSFGKQLWWNWELDGDHYRGWHERLVAYTQQHNIRIMTYVNPYLADVSSKPNARRSLLSEALALGYLVTTRAGRPYFIENTSFHAAMVDLTNPAAACWLKGVIKSMLHDCKVDGYMADFGEALPFDASLSSGESPETAHNRYPELWARLNEEVFQEYAAEKGRQRDPASSTQTPSDPQPCTVPADSLAAEVGEKALTPGVPGFPSVIEDETVEEQPLVDCLDQALPAARSAANLEALILPEMPEGGAGEHTTGSSSSIAEHEDVVQEVVKNAAAASGQSGQSGEGDAAEDAGVFFMRAGFRGSPRFARLFWLGDQMVSWQRHDGIKSAVTGLLTGGLAGYAYNHSDVGGYTTVQHPLIRYRRSEELLLRWMELNACTAVFRTHEGNIPTANCQFYSNARTLAHFRRCALLHRAWRSYRRTLVKEAADTGMPIARHLFLHYHQDPKVWALTYQQFLVGTELLVVPVLDPGVTSVAVYLPGNEAGEQWRHVWSGHEWAATRAGKSLRVEAPMGSPAVFVKVGSTVGQEFEETLRSLNLF